MYPLYNGLPMNSQAFLSQVGVTGQTGTKNGHSQVTAPRKCLINRVGHRTENPCVRGLIPRGATVVTVVNNRLAVTFAVEWLPLNRV